MQNYNLLVGWEETTEDSPGIAEPVSVAELKNYLRLESFEDNQASTANVTFDSDDALLELYIEAARQALERYTGCSFIPKNYRITLTNLAGKVELPFGPIGDVTALYYDGDDDLSDNDIADAKFTRGPFKQLVYPCSEDMVLIYSCGYGRGDTPPLPENLKLAIMAEASYNYTNRGEDDEQQGLCKVARMLAAPFMRTHWIG